MHSHSLRACGSTYCAAAKQPDGSLTTGGINVGRDGVVPPM